MTSRSDMARLGDPKTQTIRRIPVAELAPGWIKVRIEGRDGEFWVDSATLTPSPIRQAELPDHLIARIHLIAQALGDANPISEDEWVPGFQRDANPENEIVLWEHIATTYLQVTRRGPVDLEKRKAICVALITFSSNGTEHPNATFSSPHLTRDEIRALASEYEKATP